MHLRRLVLSEQRRPRSAKGVRKPRLGRRASRLTPSVGAIFGATLKSVLDFSGVQPSKPVLVDALRHVARFLAPTRAAVESCAGADRQHLANGLMAHRVASAQRAGLEECREPQNARTWLGRSGLKDVAVGVTAAVLVAHYVMSVTGTLGADDAQEGLALALSQATALLAGWPVGGGSDADWHVEALRAEQRALDRVRAAASAAAADSVAQKLPRIAALQLQLDRMRQAAWPRGGCCDAASHLTACETLAAGRPLGAPEAPEHALPPLATVPLAALPAEVWMSSAGTEADSSEEGSDARSLASSASSWSSASPSVGSHEDDAEADAAGGTSSADTEHACRMFSLL